MILLKSTLPPHGKRDMQRLHKWPRLKWLPADCDHPRQRLDWAACALRGGREVLQGVQEWKRTVRYQAHRHHQLQMISPSWKCCWTTPIGGKSDPIGLKWYFIIYTILYIILPTLNDFYTILCNLNLELKLYHFSHNVVSRNLFSFVLCPENECRSRTGCGYMNGFRPLSALTSKPFGIKTLVLKPERIERPRPNGDFFSRLSLLKTNDKKNSYSSFFC